MQRIEDFVDDRQKTWCIHCTRALAGLDTNDDHVPSKSLITKPRPHHLPVVKICRDCNISFSLDEQYAVTFLSCVLCGSTDPKDQPNTSAARALRKSSALRSLIERSRTEYITRGGDTRVVWKPDATRIERVVLKNARGHAYFEYGEPMLGAPKNIWALPLESLEQTARESFEGLDDFGCLAPLPEVGSRMMARLISGEDMHGHWVIVQEGTYRYSVEQNDGIRVRSVLSEYLATEVLWSH